MEQRMIRGSGRRKSWRPVWMAGVMVAVGLVAGCSSDAATSQQSIGTAPVVASDPTVTLAAELPAKEAVDALKSLFRAAGVDPDVQPELRVDRPISECPLGGTDQLTAVPPAPVAGLATDAKYSLQLSREQIPSVRCSFSDPASANVAFLEYQAAFVPGSQLQRYLSLLESNGYDKHPDTVVGGIVYSHCSAPDATATTIVGDQQDCSAVWMNGVIEVGLRFEGSGKPTDVTPWLATLIEPIINSLAKADVSAVVPTTVSSTP